MNKNECIEFVKRLTIHMTIGRGRVIVDHNEDRIKIDFPDRGSESVKLSQIVIQKMKSKFPDIVEEWLTETERDRDGDYYLSIEGWWK